MRSSFHPYFPELRCTDGTWLTQCSPISWHEQDAYEILASVNTCIDEAVSKFEANGRNRASIRTVGLTNQRETTVVWDRSTGEALCRAIAWPDTRTAAVVRELKARSGSEQVADACGLPFSTYPSAMKLVWLLRNNESVTKAYADGRLAFGTVDTWLLHKLSCGVLADQSQGSGGEGESGGEHHVTGEPVFVTDATNASRTMLADLEKLEYRRASLDFFELDPDRIALPRIVPSADARAFGRLASGALRGTPVTGCLGDQSAALVGQRAFEPGAAKNTYGTGCFLLCNVGERPVKSTHGLLSTVAYHLGEGRAPTYALEGSIAVAGSGVQFLAHNLGLADSAAGVTELAGTVEDSGGCVFVTAFSGLFAPYWIDSARGTIYGLSQHTQKGHIARAVLEAACFQTRAILDAMEKDSGHRLGQLAVDGGMSSSDLCMQVCVAHGTGMHHAEGPCVTTAEHVASLPLFDRPAPHFGGFDYSRPSTDAGGYTCQARGEAGHARDHVAGRCHCGRLRGQRLARLYRARRHQPDGSDALSTSAVARGS